MAHCDPEARTRAADDLRTIAHDVALGICSSRQAAQRSTFHIWTTFCDSLSMDPTLAAYPDPVPAIQLFAHRYRAGELSPSRTPVRGRTVGDAVRAIGQTLAGMGLPDPRLTSTGQLDFRLMWQLAKYSKDDDPPNRVKPIPLSILQQAVQNARHQNTPFHHAIADLIVIGFFFLLRPGEYAATESPDASPFCLKDTQLFHNSRPLATTEISQGLIQPNFISLTFTKQKNGVRGKVVGLGPSGDPAFCPVTSIQNRLQHLLRLGAPPATPLYTYDLDLHGNRAVISSTHISTALRSAVTSHGAPLGLRPSDVSVRSLRSSGAMALFCAKVDTDQIRLLGRWRSDEMLRYLHVQAVPVVAPIASAMLRNGQFHFIPNSNPGDALRPHPRRPG
jgi:hypothetical protein